MELGAVRGRGACKPTAATGSSLPQWLCCTCREATMLPSPQALVLEKPNANRPPETRKTWCLQRETQTDVVMGIMNAKDYHGDGTEEMLA